MASFTTEDGKYRIESMSAATFPGAIKVLRKGIIPDEAVCVGAGVNEDPISTEEMLELCADAALDGLSVVAVHTDTGEVVSTVFGKLQEAPTPGCTEKTFFEIFTEERCKRPASVSMMEFMINLDAQCNYLERYDVDCRCEIMFLGTLREHRRKGLAKLVTKTVVELAKKYKDGPVVPLTIADLGPDYAFLKPRKPVTIAPKLCTALWSADGSKKLGKDLVVTTHPEQARRAHQSLVVLKYYWIIYLKTKMASFTTEDGKYRIESMSAATFPGALKVLREGLIPDEAVCVGTGVDQDPISTEEMLELCADAALDGLSVVAVATDTGEVVATVFGKLQEAPTPGSTEKSFFEIFTEERCKRPASVSIMEFMVDLDAQCNYFERYGVDCCCEIMFLGTLREHRRKGLAKLVTKTVVELAKKYKDGPVAPLSIADLGPDYAFMKPRKPVTKAPKLCTALWSADGSKKLGKDLGFEVLLTVSLADYTFDGKRYSDRVGAVTTCEGAALRI